MANLFAKAKKVAPVKASKDEKKVIKITDPSFFSKVEKLEELQDRMKSDKAKADMLADEIKDLGKEEWAKLYEETGKNPETVMLEQENENGDNGHVMFMVTDKYITITTEARAEELQDAYGEDIVEEKTTFSFDNEMIEKYGEVLSRMIEECSEIAERDREKIIKAVTTYSVAKGTIDNFKKYGPVQEMIESVRPVVALKNVEIIKG